jgi:hypothetical protein
MKGKKGQREYNPAVIITNFSFGPKKTLTAPVKPPGLQNIVRARTIV